MKNNNQNAKSVDEINPGFDLEIFEEINKQKNLLYKAEYSKNLKIILETHEKLKERKASDIVFAAPVLKQGENAVFFPHTINTIQGQAGVHKSRLAEVICSSFLKKQNCDNELLDFNKTSLYSNITVVYVDTERNLSEQLPFALQSIQTKAGFEKSDNPVNFEYISLLQISRKDRFFALNEYLNHIRQKTENQLFIVLDVSTDCIEDFNKVEKSMELIDLMNMAINEYNVIFLCLIHENPKSDKGRGHFGTELMNKSSTLMQVGFEKDANQNETNIVRVKYLKCRSTAKHSPFYIKYSDEYKGLVLADSSEVSDVVNSRKHKASNEDIIDHIEMYLGDDSELTRNELLDKLCKDFKASVRTIESRLKEIIDSVSEIFNEKGVPCYLFKETREKIVYYKLKANETF